MADIADWLIRPSNTTSAKFTAAEMKFCMAMGITNAISARLNVPLKSKSVVFAAVK